MLRQSSLFSTATHAICVYSARSGSSNPRQPVATMNHHEAMLQIRNDLDRFAAKPISQSQKQHYVQTLMHEMKVDQVSDINQ